MLSYYFSDPYSAANRGGPFGMQTTSLYPGQGAYAASGARPSQGAFASPGLSQSQGGAMTPTSVSPTPISELLNQGQSSGSATLNTTFPTGPSSATILIQPQNVKKGGPILVSWTSVNMKLNSCKVLRNDSAYAEGNDGMKQDTVPTDTSVLTFVLQCESAGGETVRSSTQVSITNQ